LLPKKQNQKYREFYDSACYNEILEPKTTRMLPMETEAIDNPESSGNPLDVICRELTRALEGIGAFQRRFFPPEFSALQKDLFPFKASLKQAKQELEETTMPAELQQPGDVIADSSGLVLDALEMIVTASTTDFQQTVVQVMKASRKICRVQENLYDIRFTSPHLNRFFLEFRADEPAATIDLTTQMASHIGLSHVGTEDGYYARGALSLYVPESYDDRLTWPLVIALHGGFGHGRDFIWTWLREARSRKFILLSPTSIETTWSLLNPDLDGTALISKIDYVKNRWNIDMDRILLTGISDGATFALMCSLQQNLPYTAFAPVAGVLPPVDISSAKGERIYWIHGALDWMFPVQTAQSAAEALKAIGADVTLRVIDDLSHTYPREENDSILKWFDSGLALPE
jgi:phospholipase/carboxylesterase